MSTPILIGENQLKNNWVRSNSGMVAGVCEGLARRFGVEAWLVRLLWLISILAFGTGLLLYAVMAFCLPREDRQHLAHDKRILGVCSRISRASGLDVGLVRTACVLLALGSFGATLIGYVIVYFVMSHERSAAT